MIAALLAAGASLYALRSLQSEPLPTPHSEHTCCLWFDEWAFERIRIGATEAEFRRQQGIQTASLKVPDDPKCIELLFDGEPATVVSVLVNSGVVKGKWVLRGSASAASCEGLATERVNVADVICYHQ